MVDKFWPDGLLIVRAGGQAGTVLGHLRRLDRRPLPRRIAARHEGDPPMKPASAARSDRRDGIRAAPARRRSRRSTARPSR